MKKILRSIIMSIMIIGLISGFMTTEAAAEEKKTNEYTFANMTYEIPVEWKEVGNSTDVNHYYYSSSSMIMVNNGSSTSGKTELTESDRNLYMKTLEYSFDKFEVLEQNTYIVGPYTGFSFKANISTNSNDSLLYAIVFDNAKQLRAFTISSYNGADDSAILDDIVASIKFHDIDPADTQQKETTTTESSKNTGTASTQNQSEFNKDTALEKAKWYVKYSSFSEKGLVKQLVFDGFSQEDAEYGAKNCEADWNQECADDAQSYLNSKSFTREELQKQLEFEGYSESQILYGLAKVGL